MVIVKDRTGESCPFCKKGKLYPTGRRLNQPPIIIEPKVTIQENTEYKCITCHEITDLMLINLGGHDKANINSLGSFSN